MAVHGNMTVPSDLNWIFIILAGGDWPPGMEGDVWQVHEALLEAADDLDGVVSGLVLALRDVVNHVDPTVGRAFWRYGERLAEQPAFYANGARDLAEMARGYSLNVQGAKISMIVQMVFAATEIIRMWVDPFEWPLIGPFIGMMQGVVRLIFQRFADWIARALQTVVRAGSGVVGRSVDQVAVTTATTAVSGVVALMAKEVLDEGLEEVYQDAIVQVWQSLESDKAWEWDDTLDSFKYGAAAGGFAGLLGGGIAVFRPRWAGHWVTAGGVEGATEVFVGAITIPEGGDPGDIWKGVVNGVVSGAGMSALHRWKHDRDLRLSRDRLEGPGDIIIDATTTTTTTGGTGTGLGGGSAGTEAPGKETGFGTPAGHDDKTWTESAPPAYDPPPAYDGRTGNPPTHAQPTGTSADTSAGAGGNSGTGTNVSGLGVVSESGNAPVLGTPQTRAPQLPSSTSSTNVPQSPQTSAQNSLPNTPVQSGPLPLNTDNHLDERGSLAPNSMSTVELAQTSTQPPPPASIVAASQISLQSNVATPPSGAPVAAPSTTASGSGSTASTSAITSTTPNSPPTPDTSTNNAQRVASAMSNPLPQNAQTSGEMPPGGRPPLPGDSTELSGRPSAEAGIQAAAAQQTTAHAPATSASTTATASGPNTTARQPSAPAPATSIATAQSNAATQPENLPAGNLVGALGGPIAAAEGVIGQETGPTPATEVVAPGVWSQEDGGMLAASWPETNQRHGVLSALQALFATPASSSEELLAGTADNGRTVYFRPGEVFTRELRATGTDEVIGATFIPTDESTRAERWARAGGHDVTHVLGDDDRDGTDLARSVVTVAHPVQGKTFFVNAHGMPGAVSVWIERNGGFRRAKLSPRAFGKVVLATAAFQRANRDRDVRLFHQIICYAASTANGESITEGLHRVASATMPAVEVLGVTDVLVTKVGTDHRTGLDLTQTIVLGGGNVVVVGGVPAVARMTVDDVIQQMPHWPYKTYDVRTRYAETIPLFSVVDRAVRVWGTLERQLIETGLLDFTAVEHIANEGARSDLVLAAAVERVRSGEHPNLFRGVAGYHRLPAEVRAQIEITSDATAGHHVVPAAWAVPVVLAPTGEPLDPDTVQQVLEDSRSARGAFQQMSQHEVEDIVGRAAAIVAESHPNPEPDGDHSFASVHLALLNNVAVLLAQFGETAARRYSADIASRLVGVRARAQGGQDGAAAPVREVQATSPPQRQAWSQGGADTNSTTTVPVTATSTPSSVAEPIASSLPEPMLTVSGPPVRTAVKTSTDVQILTDPADRLSPDVDSTGAADHERDRGDATAGTSGQRAWIGTSIGSGAEPVLQSTGEADQHGADARPDWIEIGRWSQYGGSYSFGHGQTFGPAMIDPVTTARRPAPGPPPIQGEVAANGAQVEFVPNQVYTILLRDHRGEIVGLSYPSEAPNLPGGDPFFDGQQMGLWAARQFRTSDRMYIPNWNNLPAWASASDELMQLASHRRAPSPWTFRPALSSVPFYVDSHGDKNTFKVAVNFAPPGASAMWVSVGIRGKEHARLLLSNQYFRALLSQPSRPVVYLSCETGAPEAGAAWESVGVVYDAGYRGSVWAPTGRAVINRMVDCTENPFETNPIERRLIGAQSFLSVMPALDSAGQRVAGILRLVSNPLVSGWASDGTQRSFRSAQIWTTVLRGHGGEVIGIGFPLGQDDLRNFHAVASVPHRHLDTIYTPNAGDPRDMANPQRVSRAPWTNPFYIYATASIDGYVTLSIATPAPNGSNLYSQIRVNGANFGRLIGANGFFQTASSADPSRDVVNIVPHAGHNETGVAISASAELRRLGHVGGFYAPTGRVTSYIDGTGRHSWQGVAAASDRRGIPVHGEFVTVLAATPLTSNVTDPAPWTVLPQRGPSNPGPSRTGPHPAWDRGMNPSAGNFTHLSAAYSRSANYQGSTSGSRGRGYSFDSLRFLGNSVIGAFSSRLGSTSRSTVVRGKLRGAEVKFAPEQVYFEVLRDHNGDVVGLCYPSSESAGPAGDGKAMLKWAGREFRTSDWSYVADWDSALERRPRKDTLMRISSQSRVSTPWRSHADLSGVPFYVDSHGSTDYFEVAVDFGRPGVQQMWEVVEISGAEHARLLMENHHFRMLLSAPPRPVVYLSCHSGAPESAAARESVGALSDAGYQGPVWAPTGIGRAFTVIGRTPDEVNRYENDPQARNPLDTQSFYAVQPTVDSVGRQVAGVFRLVTDPALSGWTSGGGQQHFRAAQVWTEVLRGSSGEVVGIGFPLPDLQVDSIVAWASAPYRNLDKYYVQSARATNSPSDPQRQTRAPWTEPFYVYATGSEEGYATISIVTPKRNGASGFRQVRVSGSTFGRLIGSNGFFQTASSVNPSRDVVKLTSFAGHHETGLAGASSAELRRLGHLGNFYAPTGRVISLLGENGEHSWHGVEPTVDRHGRSVRGVFSKVTSV
ncbi:hypothetical protein LFM09_49390 [Lentzea alba]|uniref:WXG100-like domain-containing protein n=1 Tax=Lentzea alba TaxID=2714351 RepID=UPI0039BF1A26